MAVMALEPIIAGVEGGGAAAAGGEAAGGGGMMGRLGSMSKNPLSSFGASKAGSGGGKPAEPAPDYVGAMSSVLHPVQFPR